MHKTGILIPMGKKKKNKNESEIGPKNTQISESLTKKFEKNGLENAA